MNKYLLLIFALAVILSACTLGPGVVQGFITATPSRTKPTATSFPPANTEIPTPTPRSLVGCVSSKSLRVRGEPTTKSSLLGGLVSNTCVKVMGRNQDQSWGWIVSENVIGWVSLEYLTVDGNINELPIKTGTGQTLSSSSGSTKPTRTPSPTNAPSTVPTRTLSPTNAPSTVPTRTPTPSIMLCANTQNSVGSWVSCKIPRAYCYYQSGLKGKPTFCNDAQYPDHNFTMVKWGSDWRDYDGQCIVISGVVSWYANKPQIEATSLSQISSCP